MAKKVLLFDSANEPRVFLAQGIRKMRESGSGYFVLPERHAWMWTHHFKLYAVVEGRRRSPCREESQVSIKPSRFRSVVAFLADFYKMPEDVVADVCLHLLRERVFDWRKL